MRRPSRSVILAVLAAVALVLLAADPVRAAIEARLNPPAVADPATLAPQRVAAEHALARGYTRAVDQLKSTSGVRLPVSAAQAAAIMAKAIQDLRTVRRAALADLASASGLRDADATGYVNVTEPKLDDATAVANEAGALLAPGFFAIVSRADALFAQVADSATRELTTAPATPSPTPTR
jgi:hypothetical protein